MVAVKAGDVEGALRRPDPRIGVFLFYGPDMGLINERARAVARYDGTARDLVHRPVEERPVHARSAVSASRV